jgi:hypothetical protein
MNEEYGWVWFFAFIAIVYLMIKGDERLRQR